jgi:REP element-mobilizing transposase RayT
MYEHSNKRPASGVFPVKDQPTVVFVTFCTKHRGKWLDNDLVHNQLLEVWSEAQAWLVGRYVAMPDHVHLFAWATDSDIPLDNWMKYCKSKFSKLHANPTHRWQANHWDRRMRCERSYEEKWNYVRQNPVRGRLVDDADQWPYQGDLFKLRW